MADHDWTSAELNVHGAGGKPRMLSEPCATCILLPGNRAGIRPGRLREMVNSARRGEGFIVCHSTLVHGSTGGTAAICRGFADRYSTNYLRVMGRLGGFHEVAPPTKEGETDGHR